MSADPLAIAWPLLDDEPSRSWVDGRRWWGIALAVLIVATAAVAGLVVLMDRTDSPVGAASGRQRSAASTPTAGTADPGPSASGAPDRGTGAPATGAAIAPRSMPTGWVAVVDPGAGLALALPASPVVERAGDAVAVERTVTAADGSLLSVTTSASAVPSLSGSSAAAPAGSSSPVDRLRPLVDAAGSAVGAAPVVGAPTTVGGAPALPFSVGTPAGMVRGVAIDAGDRVHSIVSFTPIGVDAAAADERFALAVASVAVAR